MKYEMNLSCEPTLMTIECQMYMDPIGVIKNEFNSIELYLGGVTFTSFSSYSYLLHSQMMYLKWHLHSFCSIFRTDQTH